MARHFSRTRNLLFYTGLFVIAVFGSYYSFLNVEGFLIVLGGTAANAYLSFPREDVHEAFATIRRMLDKTPPMREALHNDIRRFIDWAYTLLSSDFLGLEKQASHEKLEPMLRYGVDLVVSGYSSDKVRDMLHTVADAEFERDSMPVVVLRNMAAAAPAFGMVGTLVGMTMLLQHVGSDLANLGGGLALAMMATLYGLLAARLVFLPAADKLLQRLERVRFRHYMLAEGLAMLSDKQNPFYIQDKLNSFLDPSNQFSLDNYKRRIAEAALAYELAA